MVHDREQQEEFLISRPKNLYRLVHKLPGQLVNNHDIAAYTKSEARAVVKKGHGFRRVPEMMMLVKVGEQS